MTLLYGVYVGAFFFLATECVRAIIRDVRAYRVEMAKLDPEGQGPARARHTSLSEKVSSVLLHTSDEKNGAKRSSVVMKTGWFEDR